MRVQTPMLSIEAERFASECWPPAEDTPLSADVGPSFRANGLRRQGGDSGGYYLLQDLRDAHPVVTIDDDCLSTRDDAAVQH